MTRKPPPKKVGGTERTCQAKKPSKATINQLRKGDVLDLRRHSVGRPFILWGRCAKGCWLYVVGPSKIPVFRGMACVFSYGGSAIFLVLGRVGGPSCQSEADSSQFCRWIARICCL